MFQLRGIDVSKWQGKIDWPKVKDSGIKFAIIRASAGLKKDSKFTTNIKNALANGIPVGVYVYSYATTVQLAKEEADYVLDLVKPFSITYPIYYDIEDSVQQKLTNSQRTDLICAFCDTIKQSNHIAGIYSSCSWFKTKFELNRLKKYEKWIAQWNSSAPSYDGSYGMWQYSSKGTVPGIQGDVDLNYCYTNYNLYKENFTSGTKITLTNIPLYTSCYAKKATTTVTGTYYLFDGTLRNNRYRITNIKTKVGKNPMSANVSGYINRNDLK